METAGLHERCGGFKLYPFLISRHIPLDPPFLVQASLIWKRGYENYPHIRNFIKVMEPPRSN